MSATLFGSAIAPDTLDGMAARLAAEPMPAGEGVRLLVTMNLDHVVNLRRNARFRAAYAAAWAVTVDGAPVALYGRLKGVARPRVTGADLTVALSRRLEPGRHRPFFVVATEATATALRGFFAARGFPAAAVGTAVPPFGFERDAVETAALADAIRTHEATHLVMGVGAPKSEIWVDENRDWLGDLYALCVGSAPDFMVGTARRAPERLRRLGLEWAWRVAGQPRRLARRYFVASWAFLPAVIEDWTSSRTVAAPSRVRPRPR